MDNETVVQQFLEGTSSYNIQKIKSTLEVLKKHGTAALLLAGVMLCGLAGCDSKSIRNT